MRAPARGRPCEAATWRRRSRHSKGKGNGTREGTGRGTPQRSTSDCCPVSLLGTFRAELSSCSQRQRSSAQKNKKCWLEWEAGDTKFRSLCRGGASGRAQARGSRRKRKEVCRQGEAQRASTARVQRRKEDEEGRCVKEQYSSRVERERAASMNTGRRHKKRSEHATLSGRAATGCTCREKKASGAEQCSQRNEPEAHARKGL